MERIIRKLSIIIHKILFFRLYHSAKTVKLYGTPKYICSDRVHFGVNNRINEAVFMHAKNHIYLGDNVTLSYGVSLITESYDTSDFEKYTKKKHAGMPIFIGDNVWLGANSIVLPGVKIEKNIIVGAGAVVTNNLCEQYYIYAGNPARKIKKIGD